MIPPLRLGSVALDLSFLIVMIGAYVLLARQPCAIFFVTVVTAPRHVSGRVATVARTGRRYCSDRQELHLTTMNG